jgi:hypothetical protein
MFPAGQTGDRSTAAPDIVELTVKRMKGIGNVYLPSTFGGSSLSTTARSVDHPIPVFTSARDFALNMLK